MSLANRNLLQGRGRGDAEDDGVEAFARTGKPASGDAGGPRVRKGGPKQSGAAEARPRRSKEADFAVFAGGFGNKFRAFDTPVNRVEIVVLNLTKSN